MKILRLLACPACLLLLCLLSAPTLASEYDMPPPGSDVIGKVLHIKAKESDTFVSLAQKYDVGYNALVVANPGVDAWLPGEGTPLTIPTAYILPNVARKGIVVNLPEMRVYYFPPKNSKYAGKVFTFPIGIGREGWSTPLVHTKIIQKINHPTWTPPPSIRKEHAEKGDPLPAVVPAGPDNPLGQQAMRLGLPSYLMHGTNKPAGIGMRVSHGCIRLFPKDIKTLFDMATVGTPVNIISEPYKVGWKGNKLMLEAHSPTANGNAPARTYTPWVKALIAATKGSQTPPPVNWNQAQKIVHAGKGIPMVIGTKNRQQQQETGQINS